MRQWSKSDVIGIINIVIGVLGFLVIILQALPSLLPEVAVVWDISEDKMVGLSTATTRFRNISYRSPISSLEAVWEIDGAERITVAVDPGAPRHSLESTDNRTRKLKILDPIPAAFEFRTVFNSASPFHVFGFAAKATRMTIGPSGPNFQEVPVIRRDTYEKLASRRYMAAALLLAVWVIGYATLSYVTKWILT